MVASVFYIRVCCRAFYTPLKTEIFLTMRASSFLFPHKSVPSVLYCLSVRGFTTQ